MTKTKVKLWVMVMIIILGSVPTKCYEGDEWQDKPEEWPRCEDQTSEECTGHADVIEDETGDGYCSSCVDMMAGMGMRSLF